MYHVNPRVILYEWRVSVPHTHRDTSWYFLDLKVLIIAKEITYLLIVVDTSRATFWRPCTKNMAFATIESGADGIMLEVHLNPKKSDVDSLQPINYKDFKNIFKK